MNTPPALLAAGLLFWGYFSGFHLPALVMALVIEAPRWLNVRWDLQRKDFERVADLCTIAFATALFLQFLQSRHFPDSLVMVLAWLPMLFFALILAQRFSLIGQIPLSALFWSLRPRRNATDKAVATITFDHAYFFGCALAASSANPRTHWFFIALSLLALYALWPIGAKRIARPFWLGTFVSAMALAFGIQLGLQHAQSSLEEMVFQWLAHRWQPPADPYQSRTAIGDIGELKNSDRILLRVSSEKRRVPERLRHAAYNVYGGGTWTAPGQSFMPIPNNDHSWQLGQGEGESVRISSWLSHDKALLALPLGTVRIDELDVGAAQRNALGAVRVDQGPDMLRFEAAFNPALNPDAAPSAIDLIIPQSVLPTLAHVSRKIKLPTHDAHAAASALTDFFRTQFTYTLDLSGPSRVSRSLSAFLLDDRRGHCEYFATATVLLLRYAGVPARYATGYSIQEWSALENQYVVRSRHAHAWALAWIDGRWREIDTTPAVWAEAEAQNASWLQPLYDIASLLNYRLTLWQSADHENTNARRVMLTAAAVLFLYLAWRIWRRHRLVRPHKIRRQAGKARQVLDERIARILERLAALGHVRPDGMALLRWSETLPLADPQTRALLRESLFHYYRARFDPQGLPQQEDELFTAQSEALMKRLAPRTSSIAP